MKKVMEDNLKMPFGHYHDVQRPATPVKVLLIAESKPASGNYFYRPAESSNNSFFHGVMQAIGIEEDKDKHSGNESELLTKFLAQGFFLIDACPEPINKEKNKPMSTAKRVEAIRSHKENLSQVIDDLKPQRIVFLCKTNESIAKEIALGNHLYSSSIVRNNDSFSFPYPGNGWLSRKDGKGCKDLLLNKLKAPIK
jgi:hypothetical protein